jgi:hypothetical protein
MVDTVLVGFQLGSWDRETVEALPHHSSTLRDRMPSEQSVPETSAMCDFRGICRD